MLKRLIILSLIFALAGCSAPTPTATLPPAAPTVVQTRTLERTATDTSTPTPAPIPATPTETFTPTETPRPTETPLPTETFTPVKTPTPVVLRGAVNVERVSCRYGPGAMYLFLYGLRQTATQNIIGRTDTGDWVLTQGPGDDKQCWVKAQYFDFNGDVMSLPVVYPEPFKLIVSPYYNPPFDVQAVRDGDNVTITWKSQPLRAGDEEGPNMVIYIVEVWTCAGGQVTFKPTGTNYATLTVTDEAGCSTPSFGRVFFQEKHGFAGPAEIPWPPRP